MKFVSLITRIGLLALAMILISVLSADAVWADSSENQPTTNGLADSLLNDWALPLLFVGVLMAASMIGAAYLIRDERRKTFCGNLEVKRSDRSSMGISLVCYIIHHWTWRRLYPKERNYRFDVYRAYAERS